MAAERAQNLQDTFLNHVRKDKIPLTIFLVNGVKLQGVVTWFDNFCVLLRRDGHSQLVYKHAISTIMPGAPGAAVRAGRRSARKPETPTRADAAPCRIERPARLAEPERDVAAGTTTLVVGPYPTRVAAARARGRTATRARRGPARRGGRARDGDRPRLSSSASIVPLATPRPATYLGKGKVEELAGRVRGEEIGLVVDRLRPDARCSSAISRRSWGAKVIDRTGLILEIFGRRARTKEGALQVELAHLNYQKSRLVRSWTHLERQRGGFGFLGGPGETQIEADRRMIQERMSRIERDLETVVQHPRACTARAGGACLIRSSRSSATPMPASRRCSTA